ncbi:MAG: hypothetical protein U0610_27355 [bacterium]
MVITTGAPSMDSATAEIRWRVSEYLARPFMPAELARVVRAAANAGRLARARDKLLAARFGGSELTARLAATERGFARAMPRSQRSYAPIVRAADGAVFGFEVLLGCDEPTLAPRAGGARIRWPGTHRKLAPRDFQRGSGRVDDAARSIG